MSLFEDVMALAVNLTASEREHLGQALGLKLAGSSTRLPLAQAPRGADWKEAERGHAVLNTAAAGAAESGAAAVAGMWSHHPPHLVASEQDAPILTRATELPSGQPVLVHTDVCTALALGGDAAREFFAARNEIRLSTASYLALLSAAEDATQLARWQAFAEAYAVLSLGPLASHRAVELMLAATPRQTGLTALDALIAATALAHEIPLVVVDGQPYAGLGLPLLFAL